MTSPLLPCSFMYGDAPNGGVIMPTVVAQRDPGNNDKYDVGYQWINSANDSYWVLTGYSAGVPNWSSGGNNPATTTDYGTVILTDNSEPVATKVYVDNIAIAGAPAWSETISGIGQLSTNAEALAGTDDNTAMTPLKVAAVFAKPFSIGSTTPAAGAFTTLGATGLITASGSATITTGATALNLASDASTGAVNIGTGAGARTITIGNITGATAVAVNTGTGSFTVTTTGTGDVILNSADTVLIDSAGVLELNSSAGVIGIGNDAVAQNINIGTGAAARTITIGNGSGATSVVLNAGTGAINIGTNAVAHTVSIGNSTGATSVVLDSGTGPINVGTNAVAHTVTIGNVTGATAVNVNTGTGGTTYTTTNGIFTLATGTGAISVSADAAATTLNIGTGAAAKTVTLGSSNTTSTTTIRAGTNGIVLSSAGIVTMAPTTDTQASPTAASTQNSNVGYCQFTGFTTAAGASQIFTITNSIVTTNSALFVTVANEGANDAQMTITQVKRAAGSFTVTCKNNGAAALNGNVGITFWVIKA